MDITGLITSIHTNNNPFLGDPDRDSNIINDYSTTTTCTTPTENGSESPPPSSFHDSKNITTSTTTTSAMVSSPKKRRAVQKRVVSIPIKEVEGSRLKGESTSTPPSDSWAWRKYGQKPIKGSPYPRGYYRCSSSKGCPARKQVERSRVDPTMLLITYSAEHNHPWPASRNHHHHHHHNHNQSASATAALKIVKEEAPEAQPDPDMEPEPEPEERFAGLGGDDALVVGDEFGWFGDMDATSSSPVLESPIFAESGPGEAAAVFPMMREEDESLFADLGELPECSLVFRHRGVGPQVQIC